MPLGFLEAPGSQWGPGETAPFYQEAKGLVRSVDQNTCSFLSLQVSSTTHQSPPSAQHPKSTFEQPWVSAR